MSEHLHDIDYFFKTPIEANSEMPAVTVWEAIENNFDKNNHVQLKKKYQNLKRVAAVLLFLLCGSIFFLISKNKPKENIVAEKNNSIEAVIKNTSPNTIEDTKSNKSTLQINNFYKNTSPTSFVVKNNKNTFTTNTNAQFIKTPTTNIILKNNETDINNQLEQNFETKNKIQLSKNKAQVVIKNANAEEETAFINTDNNIAYTLLQTPIVLKEKIKVISNLYNSQIYLPTLPTMINKNIQDISTNKKLHSFSATIYASPEFSFNRLEDDKPHQDGNPPSPQNAGRPRDDRDKIKKEENKTTSFSAGILIDYSLSKKFTIQSGVGFTSKTTEVKPKKVFAEQNANGEIKYKNTCSLGTTYIDPKTGVVVNIGDSTNLGFTKNTVQYISIPLNIIYHFQVGKFKISPTAGATVNFLVTQKASTNIEGAAQQNINKIEGIDKNYFNANIGFGIDYKLGKNISLTAMPTLRLGLNALNTNSNVKFYSNTAGLLLGVKYGF